MYESSAISINGVKKIYRLYGNPKDQAFDVLGLQSLFFWRKPSVSMYPALNGISLNIKRGERVGIVGRNGSGKTTLLKLITGNFAPTVGRVDIDGTVQALMDVGLGFHPELSGYDNIRFSLNYNGLPSAELKKAVEDIVDFAELGEFLHQPVRTYSLGMQTRLMFATATAIKPDILIVDEVLGAGDAYFGAKSARRMERLAKSGCTLLLVSHAMQQILQFCERVVWLDKGRIVLDGPAHEVVGAYEVHMEERIKIQQQLKPENPTPSPTKDKLWVTKMIAEQSILNTEEVEISQYMTEIDGFSVFRWPGKTGIKIQSLFLNDGENETSIFRSGEALALTMEVKAEIDGPFSIKYYLAVFDLRGNRVAWITSPTDNFSLRRGSTRTVNVSLDPLLLGGGDYVCSVSIFDAVEENYVSADSRHDLLARCLNITVIENDGRQSPFFHHPSIWRFTDRSKKSASVPERLVD